MSIDEFWAKVKSVGGRMTKTRESVLKLFLTSKRPMSAAEILNHLKQNKIEINRTTVYRELNFLIKNNFVRKVNLVGKETLFELGHLHRHHLICMKCKSIKSVEAKDDVCCQNIIISKKENFQILDHAFEFYGLCKNCQ